MICNCGATTEDRTVVEKGKVVWRYERCPKCGRIDSWYPKPVFVDVKEVLPLDAEE